MKRIYATRLSLIAALMLSASVSAQDTPTFHAKKGELTENELKRWSHLDLAKDSVPGMSVDKAYNELLKGKTGVKVIVGIVDSGIDIEHEDLKPVIWTNKKEIAGNGKDDDKNGYIDDIHGWNFLGDIVKEHYEYQRIAADNKLADEETYLRARKMVDSKYEEAAMMVQQMQMAIPGVAQADEMIQKHLGKTEYTIEEVQAIETTEAALLQSKMIIESMLSYGLPLDLIKIELQKQHDRASELLATKDQPLTNYRKILGDNPNNIKDKKYGNNNVIGPDKPEALHGTHVAGIVAQVRNNAIGGDGIANNVEIMALRAVPDGDEYDKDIALAIRYAVDNGAKVINGSFGKSFSPQKQWVFDAIKYAESKDVLFVHAAGNDSKDIDVEDNFPNDSKDKKVEFAANVITVGALAPEFGPNMIADFSNYGKLNVDVFAPGVQIYATTPENGYQYLQGTSMASPNVAGVAALIRSYYPSLSAKEVKTIIMESGTYIANDVYVGGNPDDARPFPSLSVSGKIVNAYNALVMAEKMSQSKGKKK
jgi:cell wall-associated protease